jgi:hypothetical protein
MDSLCSPQVLADLTDTVEKATLRASAVTLNVVKGLVCLRVNSAKGLFIIIRDFALCSE